MKVIFLDIDGVLNVIPKGFDEYGGIFHENFVDNLKNIIEQTGAKLVISSSWRCMGVDWLKDMWGFRKYPGEIIDITPNEHDVFRYGINKHENKVIRGEEIKLWLMVNEVDNYVIIDDDTDMLPEQFYNFVKTSENSDHEDCIDIGYGLTKKCSELAIKILNNER